MVLWQHFGAFPNHRGFLLGSQNGLGYEGPFKGLLIQPCTEQGHLHWIVWLSRGIPWGKEGMSRGRLNIGVVHL